MMDLVINDRPAERTGHMLLADHFGKSVRTVASVERQRRGRAQHSHRRNRIFRCRGFGRRRQLVDLTVGGLDVAGRLRIWQRLVEQAGTLLPVTRLKSVDLVVKVWAVIEAKVFVHPVSLCSGADSFHFAPGDEKGPPAHPVELTCPCCLPALGELGEGAATRGTFGQL